MLSWLVEEDVCKADLTTQPSANSLFGASPEFRGEGTKLSKFLLSHHQKEGVVLLDEIDKAEPDLLAALYPIFETGVVYLKFESQDVDVSKIIWLVTTNWAQDIITSFCGSTVNRGLLNRASIPGLRLEGDIEVNGTDDGKRLQHQINKDVSKSIK